MRNGPRRQVGRGVEQVLNQGEILLFALNARAEFSCARLLEVDPKIVASLEPLSAPGKRIVSCRLRLNGHGQSQKQEVSVAALGNENTHVLVACFAAHRVVVRKRNSLRKFPEDARQRQWLAQVSAVCGEGKHVVADQ